MDDEQILATASAIRTYLVSRPNAKDTAEGIHQWWIEWDHGPGLIYVTVAALEHLEAEGLLEQIQSGRRQLWRRKNASVSAAQA